MNNWDRADLDLRNKNRLAKNLIVPVGKVPGVLLTVFGSIGMAIFGIPIMIMVILAYATSFKVTFYSIATGLFPLLVISIISFANGNRIRGRLRRFQRYVRCLNHRHYCLIKELAAATGQSNKATVKDLQKMIGLGMFPEGSIDHDHTYFILRHELYKEYLKLQEGMKMKELQNKEAQKEKTSDTLGSDQRKVIQEGRNLIHAIKKANDMIPGEELSKKLDQLEEIAHKIFDHVEKHPEKLPQLTRFTQYFLPTTLKLANTYAKLDYQPIEGKNISSAKKEIEDTMDGIYHAFENLLDGLFEDVALDISTDISVLETMLAQDGLTKSGIDFEK